MRASSSVLADLPPDRPVLRELVTWWLAGVDAVEPRRLVATHLRSGSLSPLRTVVLAVGKAAAAMGRGADDVLPVDRGIIVADEEADVPPWAVVHIGGHPLPNAASTEAGQAAYELAGSIGPGERMLALISGGGSSLMTLPHPDLDLPTIRTIVDQLIQRGAPIGDINGVRTAMSRIKGGGLARACGQPITTLVLSDVPDGDAGSVASGPTVGSRPTRAQVAACFDRYGITGPEADRVLALAAEPVPPSPVEPDAFVVGDGPTAAAATAAAVRDAIVDVHTSPMTGDAAAAALAAIDATPPGTVRVFHGETTVEVGSGGHGGRNQHAALAAAIAISGTATRFLAAGTDGIDGPTDAAGAVVDGRTVADPGAGAAALARCDSNTFFERAGGLIRTGRTGTNVADLWIVDRRG